ncbi:MAG: hypothetical protein ABI811_02640 [Acidobacteriota bacterium]
MGYLSIGLNRVRMALLATLSCGLATAQVTVAGRPVEVHAFFSQAFVKSGSNNYLTMQSSRGAFDFTDGGFNVTSRLSDKLRVGIQGYVRNLGNLGNGHVILDWASVDYRFKDYLGVRAGRVKTVVGLYNDTQDLEFLHTWAILPQSVYPLDLRGFSLSHLGGDIYGSISPRGWGSFSYTAYVGRSPQDPAGGRAYAFTGYGLDLGKTSGWMSGADLKWNTPLQGLLLGASFQDLRFHSNSHNVASGGRLATDTKFTTVVFSAQYSLDRLRLDYERSRSLSTTLLDGAHGLGPGIVVFPYDQRGWYAAAAYRVWTHLELGSYHSRFYPNADRQLAFQPYKPAVARHLYDQAMTARFDFKSHWDLKAEQHFMDGFGDPASSRGFYLQDNPQGLAPKTKLFVLRLGFNY